MPSSPKPNLAFIITLQICGVATASAQHDNYQSKLDELAKSPDPELSDGLLFNEVFSVEINDAFTDIRHASTSFKYYANVEMIDFPNGIFAEENDRLIIKTQEILLENDLPALLNDDLYEFTNNDLNFTEEIRVSEFSTIHNYNVLFWEGTRIVDEFLNQNIYSFHIRGPMIYEGTTFSEENYATWIHVHIFFESNNGKISFTKAREIVESIKFLDSMNKDFEIEEKTNVTANFPLYSKEPQWYESTWFGNYYDSTKGWLYHDYLGWVYTEGSSTSGHWLWHENLGWFWTRQGVYPYLYSTYESDWLYLNLAALNPKKYFSFAWSEWVNLTDPNIEIRLDQLKRSNTGSNNPRDLKRDAIQIISSANIPEEEANKRISKIILYGL